MGARYLMPPGPAPTRTVAITCCALELITDTVPANVLVMKTRRPSRLMATPWAPRSTVSVRTTAFRLVSIAETVLSSNRNRRQCTPSPRVDHGHGVIVAEGHVGARAIGKEGNLHRRLARGLHALTFGQTEGARE